MSLLALSFLKSQFPLLAGSLFMWFAPVNVQAEAFEMEEDADLQQLLMEVEKLEAQQEEKPEDFQKALPKEK
ncbi:MAG: hypothetical protein ABF391_10045 [Akkermansiaceae bacterium]|jgi:hypothetical protein